MGNSQSNEPPRSASSNSATPSPTPASPATRQPVARRQENVGGSSHANSRSSHTPPTAALISTSSSASTSTQPTRAHAHAHGTPSPGSSHTRARSITAPGSAPRLKPESPANSQRSASPAMGNDLSRLRPPSRSSTLPIDPPASESQEAQSETRTRPPPSPSPSSRPVDVPTSSHPHPPSEPFALPADDSPYSHAPSNYNRPPRLPLPIEEEVHTPGSPIITSQDITSPIDEKEDDGALPRRTSILSHTTVDDDEIVDHDMFTGGESLAPTVPTTIEWKGPGEKVYVTGTFVMWEKKFKLHRHKDTGHFSATLQLKPGTHHIKFLVDADMVTSEDLPTTVDFTNILVNYVEVVAPMPSTGGAQPSAPARPIPIPGAATTAEGTADKREAVGKPVKSAMQEAETPSHPPGQSQTQKSQPIPVPESQHGPSPPSPKTKSERAQQQQQIKPPKQVKPRPQYTSQIPQYEADYDLTFSDADPERSQRVKSLLNTLPQPPSLPLFLAKSILNGTTPHKDDASVLIMPNHTVLNHLATSSIKNQVLATSGTTRYKRKFLTTIMYKPTTEDG